MLENRHSWGLYQEPGPRLLHTPSQHSIHTLAWYTMPTITSLQVMLVLFYIDNASITCFYVIYYFFYVCFYLYFFVDVSNKLYFVIVSWMIYIIVIFRTSWSYHITEKLIFLDFLWIHNFYIQFDFYCKNVIRHFDVYPTFSEISTSNVIFQLKLLTSLAS